MNSPSARPGSDFRIVATANAIVFVSSMFVMMLELVASRLVAQHLGVSLYTWTSVIGVVLAGISLGNYIGGKLADIYPPRALLPALFLLASVLSLSVLFLVDWMGTWERPESLSWPLWILQNVSLTFLLPSIVLGTISPVAARAALAVRRDLGATIGSLYSAGAAGSILGTFLTGYVLIDWFGSKAIVCAVAAGLALLGLLTSIGSRRSPAPFFAAWLLLVTLVSVLSIGQWHWSRTLGHFFGLRFDDSYLHYQDESSYFAIEIYDDDEFEDTRVLALDHLVHSYVNMNDVTDLAYAYETVYAAITARLSMPEEPLRAFFIGGGGFTFPRYLEALYPRAEIDVAEIDPAVTRAAREALGLPPPEQSRIRAVALDARNFVDDANRRNRRSATPQLYDFVYGDAFNDLGVPYHLTTRGFNERLRELMTANGVYLINIIDVFRPGLGRFLGAFVGTVRQTFPNVYIFSSDPEGISEERDTFIVVSSPVPLNLQDLGARRTDPQHEGTLFAWAEGDVLGGEMATVLQRGRGVILTDDYAPVDNLLAPVFAIQ